MENTSILVLGAGELGMPVIRSMVKKVKNLKNIKITVLLRQQTINSTDVDKKRNVEELKALGVEFLAGDLTASSSALIEIFKQFDAIVSCTSYGSGAGGFQLKLTDAVLKAGVKRYFPWQFGVDFEEIGRGSAQELFDEQLDVRAVLRSQKNTKWVIISTGLFTSYLFEPFFGVVNLDTKVVNALGSWDTAVTVTTPDDIGKLTAEIFFDEPVIEDQIVYIGGDRVTYEQVADIADSLSGEKFKRKVTTVSELNTELKNDPDNFVNKYRHIFGNGAGVSWNMDKTFNCKKGIETMSAKQWATLNVKWK